jgi:hypothetical protein
LRFYFKISAISKIALALSLSEEIPQKEEKQKHDPCRRPFAFISLSLSLGMFLARSLTQDASGTSGMASGFLSKFLSALRHLFLLLVVISHFRLGLNFMSILFSINARYFFFFLLSP